MSLPNKLKGYFKMCKRCKIVKPVSEFSKHSRAKDGFQYWCKCCKRYHNKTVLAVISEFNRLSRRRFSEAQYICDITLDMLSDFMSFFEGNCPYTGEPLTNDSLEFDHIHARILSGEHAPWNIVITTKKNYRTITI